MVKFVGNYGAFDCKETLLALSVLFIDDRFCATLDALILLILLMPISPLSFLGNLY